MRSSQPFIISELIKRELVHNIRSANRYIEADHERSGYLRRSR